MFKSRIMILYRESLGTNLSWVTNLGTAACLLDISSAAFWFTLESCKSWSSPFLLRGFHITITLYTPTAKEGLYGVCNVPSIDTDSVVQLQQLQYFVLLCSEALFSSCYTPANGRASQEVGHTYDCAQLCVPGQLSLSITHKVGIYFLHRCLHPSLTAEQLHTFKIRETISQTKNVNKNCVHPQVPPSLE